MDAKHLFQAMQVRIHVPSQELRIYNALNIGSGILLRFTYRAWSDVHEVQTFTRVI